MKTFFAAATFAAASLLANMAVPASAQSDKRTGSRVENRLRALPNAAMADNDKLLYRIAECSTNLYEPAVRSVLAARDEESLAKAQLPLQELRRCNFEYEVDSNVEQFSMSWDPTAMRGLYAETMLRKEKAAENLQPLPLEKSYDRAWFAMTGRPIAIDDMATCVAAIDPTGVRSIFKTDYGSDEEKRAVAALGSDYGQCLQTGFQLRSDSKTIREALAEALYHRAFDPAPPADAGDKL